MPEKTSLLREQFRNQPFAREYRMELLLLNKKRSIVSMPTYDGMWTSGNIANGLTLGPVANAAGVFLAMMNCKYFTPLYRVKELIFLRPTKRGLDKFLIAEASVTGIKWHQFKKIGKQQMIVISVMIKGSEEKIKARGIFEYILMDKEYRTK